VNSLLAFAFDHSSHPVWGKYGFLLLVAVLIVWFWIFRK
jgi:hypothetical protein